MRGHLTTEDRTFDDARLIAEDAYVFGYPLIVMDAARRMHTAVPFPAPHGAPPNHFAHTRVLATAHDKEGIRPPADSLSSVAWLDVSKEPVILSVPAIDRYFLLPIWNSWYELLHVVSTRTAASGNRHLAFVGPHWKGQLPDRIQAISTPTESLWIDGRFQAMGPEDIEHVHRLQDQVRLTPLSEWGKAAESHTQPFPTDVDQKLPPVEQVSRMEAPAYFTKLARLMQRAKAGSSDEAMIERIRQIGVAPEGDFSFERLPEITSQALRAALITAKQKIAEAEQHAIPALSNKWALYVHPGRYETNYLSRAVAVRLALASSPVEDVVGLRTNLDAAGEPLKGTHQYVIRFDHGQIPPVNAFWSITLYNSKHHLAANNIQRHVIGDLNKLRLNSDSSLSIYIQHDWPGIDKDSNWLPAPIDTFELVFQLYWPKPEVLNGRWRPPGVMRVH